MVSNKTYQNFNQEGVPIAYHNFCHKSLVRPKSKLKRISSHKLKASFSQWDKMTQNNNTYQNIYEKTKVALLFTP